MSKETLTIIEGRNYPIFVGIGIMGQALGHLSLAKYPKISILADNNTTTWMDQLKKNLGRSDIGEIIVPAGEESKQIARTEKIWLEMLESGMDRSSLLINLGGGMIGDLGGFAAASYMRGIDFLQIPTSLLAMVDASVGGKTAVDVGGVKNLVGSFKNPVAVIADVETVSTLPSRELTSGFAEMIKHGVIKDRTHFEAVTFKRPQDFTEKELLSLIVESIKIKLAVVKEDPVEKGPRKTLNFGHTIGHAVESLSMRTDDPLLHGEAVAIGMVAESRLAGMMEILSEGEQVEIKKAIERTGLPTSIKGLDEGEVIEKLKTDKKNKAGRILWSLPKKIGQVGFDIEAPQELVVEAIRHIIV